MRDHAIVSPRFWTGQTGRFLRQYPDAQRLALYLMTCPSSNMIGLYYLPLPTICHELNMTPKGASEALRRVFEGGFAAYDEVSEVVFVYEMARFQVGDQLAPKDNRVKAVERHLELWRKCRFFNDFLQRYRDAFNLQHISPFEGASKPLRSQDQDQDQDQGITTPPNPPSGGVAVGRSAKTVDPETDRRFAAFWEAYPRKEAKPKAAKAFATLNPSDDLLGVLLEAIDRQRRCGCLEPHVTADGRSTIPHPASWLNARRWEDQPPDLEPAPLPSTPRKPNPLVESPPLAPPMTFNHSPKDSHADAS